jgi:hypothetical protein
MLSSTRQPVSFTLEDCTVSLYRVRSLDSLGLCLHGAPTHRSFGSVSILVVFDVDLLSVVCWVVHHCLRSHLKLY